MANVNLFFNFSVHDEIAVSLLNLIELEKTNVRNFLLGSQVHNLYASLKSIPPRLIADQYGRLRTEGDLLNANVKIKKTYIDELRIYIREKLKTGQFMLGLGASKYYHSMTLDSAHSSAQVANTNKQYKVYFNTDLKPIGVITWAWVNQECLDRIEKADDISLHPAEWNEGRILWFRDVAVSADSVSQIAHDLSVGLFPEISECYVTMHSRKLGRSIPVKFSSSERTQLSDWIQNQI